MRRREVIALLEHAYSRIISLCGLMSRQRGQNGAARSIRSRYIALKLSYRADISSDFRIGALSG